MQHEQEQRQNTISVILEISWVIMLGMELRMMKVIPAERVTL
ncbi:Uncharacterised protein [Candidatus Venteria ishoeyi]|uniref:Uncharacterized protein n=1 Tax=Candidatus Venteria ishoeyi TaxID=1899563 RepID=A0A1H6FIP6_9GAMM|nr:Uncharacterised protein [Candidatus Venteria ishoeyi]